MCRPNGQLRMQVLSVVSKHLPIAPELPAANMTEPCKSVQDNDYFSQARAMLLDEGAGYYLKSWDQRHRS